MKKTMTVARGVARIALMTVAVPVLAAQTGVLGSLSAEAAVIRSVVVQGNQRVDSETVRSYVLIQPGRNFGPVDIDRSVQALYATGLFSDVSITQRGNSLVVKVSENAVVGAVRFQGNKKIKRAMLEALLETKPRAVLTDAKLQGDVERIKGYYQHTGRAQADVRAETTPRDNGRVDVTFVITEGSRTGISDIEFVGNKAFSDGRLRSVIQTKETNFLSWFTKRDVYDDAKLAADQELLRRFYLRSGYADFRVVSAEPTFDEARNKYVITFTIEEGPRYKFGAVNVDSSIPEVSADSLKDVVKTKSGRTFNALLIERTLEDMTYAIAKTGYSFAQVRPRADRNYQTNTIDITYMVDEGPRLYVERIDVRGNDRTRDYVIRREFDMAEGDAYNRVLADRAERRLRNLGYFKSVNVTTEPGSSPDRVVIVVNVEDQSTGSFTVGGGYSTDDGFIAEVSMQEKNFLGRGQYLKITVGGGENSQNFNLSFTEPYFLGRRMALGFDTFYQTTDDTNDRPYNLDSYGGTLRLGLPITDDLDVQFNYKLANRDVSARTGVADTDALKAIYGDGEYLNSSIGYQVTYSTIDNKQDPRDGLYFRLNQDFAGVGGDGQWVKTTADARYYKEIVPETGIVGFLKVGAGNITGWGDDVAILDNFFKGGETIRGFKARGYGARYDGTNDSYALGGKNYVNATAEVQFPMPLAPSDLGLRGAVFADAGTLFDVDRPSGLAGEIHDDASIRSSVGASILWNSPFGLLRADFAQALTKESYDEEQFFRFSAGTQF